jgi:DNA primase
VRSVGLLLHKGFEVRVAELPAGLDPDDFIRESGPEAYGTLLRGAPEFLEFLIHREAHTRDLRRAEEQAAAVNAVLPHIVRLGNPIIRAAWAGRLADALRIEEGLLLSELEAALRAGRPRMREKPAAGPPELRPAEARLVSLLLRSETDRRHCAAHIEWPDVEGAPIETIVRTILDLEARGERLDYPSLLEALEDVEDRERLTWIAFRDEPEDGAGVEQCLEALRHRRLGREGRAIVRDIRRAQEAGAAEGPPGDAGQDPADVDQELLRLQELARRRDQLMG